MNEQTRLLIEHIAKRPGPPQASALKATFARAAVAYSSWLVTLDTLTAAVKAADKPYSQMTREEAERAVDEAETVLRAEYWQDVRALADSIGADLRERLSEGEDGENLREWLIEYIEQSIDGHHNVIYTRAAQKVILYSDHSGAYADEFGEEGIVENGDISWSRLAYAAMRADVIEQLDANGIDVNEPDSQSTKDSLGIETDEDEDEE